MRLPSVELRFNFEHRPVNHMSLPIRLSLTAVILMLSLSACVTKPTAVNDDPFNGRVTDTRALRQLNGGNPTAAADVYSSRAKRSSDPEQKQDYLLIAAEILLDRAMLEAGLAKFADIPEQMATPALQQRRDIVESKTLLFGGDALTALSVLPNPEAIESAFDRARLYETRAQAFNQLNDPDNELIARIELEKQLQNETVTDKNHAQIWTMLSAQPVSNLRSLTTNVRGDTYQGWIELALLNADAGNNPQLRAQKLDQWQGLFANHPATERFVARLYDGGDSNQFQAPDGKEISRIAVLLPLTDARMGTVANAIRDGLIAAYQNANNQFNRPNLQFYDVGENPAFARAAYQNAINDGADAVIGPLRKNAVSAIVTLRDIPVATVTLNTVDASISNFQVNSKVIQFGLAPEDEARSAASRAIGLNYRNAVILQADDSRGDREARAFQDAMFSYGGDVVHVAVLPQDEYDYTAQIKDALQITQSDARFKSLSRAIGQKLFFEPSVRNDVDVVFLAMGSEQARSVRPQLDFFHAAGLPRLGTSRIAALDDDIKRNKDLNSIFYPDTPWALRDSVQKDQLKQQIVKNFPQADGVYGKLYALGADAYKVVSNLQQLIEGGSFEGFTGDLSLSADGRIERQLDWAQYQEGKSVNVKSVDADRLQTIRSSGIN